MNTSIIQLKKANHNFKQHWLNYFLLFISLDIVNQVIFLPLFRYLATYILQVSAIPFISFQNFYLIITQHSIAFIFLLIELILILSVVYLQTAFILIGIRQITDNQFSFQNTIKTSFKKLKKVKFGSFFLLILYLLIVVPFAGLVYRTPLLAKIQVPEFIIDFMLNSWVLSLVLISIYLIILFFGIRLLFVLPIMIFENSKTLPAMKKSWQISREQGIFKLFFKILLVSVISILISFIIYITIYLIQLLWDLLPQSFSLSFAIVNLLISQVLSELILVWSSVVTLLMLFCQEKKIATKQHFKPDKNQRKHVIPLVIFATCLTIFAAIGDAIYLLGIDDKKTVVISHRGVNDENGVQNTIQALEKTARSKPDYVEIDLHETKDHQFVVMHDENLKKLTGVNKIPHDLTLKQLMKLTASENGYKAKIASFDQYLSASEKLNQKLLIEIKTTTVDSPNIFKNFNKKYGMRIIKDHDRLQSLDYRAVDQLKQLNPKLFMLYIQPYNFTFPQSVANGYSMEYSTLNENFIWEANLNHQPVYAWTVNKEHVMKRMMYYNIDGLITDNVTLTQKAIKDYQSEKSYANRLANYLIANSFPGKIES